MVFKTGKVVDIKIIKTKTKPLKGVQLKDFKNFVKHFADEIVKNWVDYFVLNKQLTPKKISKRIK
jgi:hypothetical protein